MRSVVLCLDPGVVKPELSSFNLIQRLSPLPVSYHLPALYGMESVEWELLHGEVKVAGIVILGSRSSVNDRLAWQVPFFRWTEEQLERRIPTLGICFGHQMLAHLYGSPIKTMAQKLQGERLVSFHGSDPLYSGSGEYRIIMSHEDYVAEVPSGAICTASSQSCDFDGLAYGDRVWSFQSHIDATPLFTRIMPHWSCPADFPFEHGHHFLAKFLNTLRS